MHNRLILSVSLSLLPSRSLFRSSFLFWKSGDEMEMEREREREILTGWRRKCMQMYAKEEIDGFPGG